MNHIKCMIQFYNVVQGMYMQSRDFVLLLVPEVYEPSYLLWRMLFLMELLLFVLCLLMVAEVLLYLLHMVALLLQNYRNCRRYT